jgi:hypothetical protein
MLVELDEAEKKSGFHKTHEIGPFSVFSAKYARSRSSGNKSRDTHSLCEVPIVEMYREDSVSSDLASLCGEVYFDTQLDLSTESFSQDIEIVDRTSDFPCCLDLELRTNFFSDNTTRELMYNYINVVADLLQPASHYQNPYKSIYVPTALVGSSDSLGGMGMLEPSPSNVAVFHAILSVSAFHLRGTENLPERTIFDKLGRLHRGKAFKSLQKALLDELDSSDHHAAISAMMSLVSSDVSSSARTKE